MRYYFIQSNLNEICNLFELIEPDLRQRGFVPLLFFLFKELISLYSVYVRVII